MLLKVKTPTSECINTVRVEFTSVVTLQPEQNDKILIVPEQNDGTSGLND